MTTLTLVAAPTDCPPWCVRHEPDCGLCLAEDIRLDLGSLATSYLNPRSTRVDLTHSDDGTTIGITFDGKAADDLSVDQAEALVHALNAQIATARGYGQIAQAQRKLALGHADAKAGV